jgi:hypothetical protein
MNKEEYFDQKENSFDKRSNIFVGPDAQSLLNDIIIEIKKEAWSEDNFYFELHEEELENAIIRALSKYFINEVVK